MPILVYIESDKKQSIEAVCYGKKLALKNETALIVICNGLVEKTTVAKYGADKIVQISTKNINAKINAVIETVKTQNVNVVILEQNANGSYIAPMLCAKLEGSYASNVIGLPSDDFIVKRAAFSNKAFQFIQLNGGVKILTIVKNNIAITENESAGESLEISLPIETNSVEILEEKKQKNGVSISEADVVVSGGRGLKGAENWHLIENLADALGGAVACSKPVSDMGWRPHREHVGQTGKPVASNVYIAIGISGAIQHLAGVNNSKVKVVINNDPEVPFFKAADYGIVGDAFEIVPKLIEKINHKITS